MMKKIIWWLKNAIRSCNVFILLCFWWLRHWCSSPTTACTKASIKLMKVIKNFENYSFFLWLGHLANLLPRGRDFWAASARNIGHRSLSWTHWRKSFWNLLPGNSLWHLAIKFWADFFRDFSFELSIELFFKIWHTFWARYHFFFEVFSLDVKNFRIGTWSHFFYCKGIVFDIFFEVIMKSLERFYQ